MITTTLVLYWLAVGGLFVYGVNCYWLSFRFLRRRRAQLERLAAIREAWAEATSDAHLPGVTVQLPVYNERYVVERLLDAVAAIDYPPDRLAIQVLDDSTDDTSALVERKVAELATRGVTVQHLRRSDRAGFKAGALAAGLVATPHELVAIFDADFVPPRDILRRCVPLFAAPDVGLVQARWGHLNRETSWLTRLQALAIDGHFGVEQSARASSGYLLNFNGTAGVWRRAAIEDAGGWTADTLTEDLDLSYRAQLAGWRLEFLPDTVVPAEIPADLLAFKSQQRRWAKGSIQTARKLLKPLLAAPLRPAVKLQAVLHLTHYLVHPLMVLVALLSIPVLRHLHGELATSTFVVVVVAMMIGAAGPSTLYLVSQRVLHADGLRRMAILPLLMLVGTGIAVSNTRAVIEALAGHRSPFVRTPKRCLTDGGQSRAPGYRPAGDGHVVAELALALVALGGLAAALESGRWFVGERPVVPGDAKGLKPTGSA